MNPKLIAVSGASGSGKTTVVEILKDVVSPVPLFRLRSVTTRESRPSDGLMYSCISREFFESIGRAGGFVWTKEIHGNLYGTFRQDFEEVMGGFKYRSNAVFVAMLTPDCFTKVHEEAIKMGRREDEMLFLRIRTPGEATLRARLVSRGYDIDSIEARVAECKAEGSGWDARVEKLGLPVHFIENNGSLDDLRREVETLVRGQ